MDMLVHTRAAHSISQPSVGLILLSSNSAGRLQRYGMNLWDLGSVVVPLGMDYDWRSESAGDCCKESWVLEGHWSRSSERHLKLLKESKLGVWFNVTQRVFPSLRFWKRG